jgi:hypothetical protein
MGIKYPRNPLWGHGLLQVVHGAQLHRIQVAIHTQASRQHENGCVSVDFDCALQYASAFKGATSLAHDNEFKLAGF